MECGTKKGFFTFFFVPPFPSTVFFFIPPFFFVPPFFDATRGGVLMDLLSKHWASGCVRLCDLWAGGGRSSAAAPFWEM